MRTVVISRSQCHLCTEAEALLARHCKPGSWYREDVDDHAWLRERYGDHVPVVFVDGRLLSYWTLDPKQLRAALDGGDWSPPPDL